MPHFYTIAALTSFGVPIGRLKDSWKTWKVLRPKGSFLGYRAEQTGSGNVRTFWNLCRVNTGQKIGWGKAAHVVEHWSSMQEALGSIPVPLKPYVMAHTCNPSTQILGQLNLATWRIQDQSGFLETLSQKSTLGQLAVPWLRSPQIVIYIIHTSLILYCFCSHLRGIKTSAKNNQTYMLVKMQHIVPNLLITMFHR